MPGALAPPRIPRLTCIIGPDHDLALVPRLVEAGVDGFQVRAKQALAAELVRLVETVCAEVAAADARATVIVNDRLDVALATAADGVHLGAEDLPVAQARRIATAAGRGDLIIGATCRDAADVDRAARSGADYVGFGPVFATTSKPGLPAPRGVDALPRDPAVPVIAIGGIDATNAAAVIAAGAHGIAAIGGIWRPPDPVRSAKELLAVLS